MSTEDEAAILSLGLDARPFQHGMNEVKASIAEGSEHIVEHMRGPRAMMSEFHKGLRLVGETFPLLEAGIKLLVSPFTGVLALGVLGAKKLYEGFKEARLEAIELAKAQDEIAKAAARPIDKDKDIAAARTTADKAASEDRRRISKEQNELNDPLEKMLANLRQLEQQFEANADSAGKLAAQRKVLAEIESQVAAAQKPVGDYNSAEQQAARKRTEFLKEEATRRIKTLEENIEKEREIQQKNKAAFEEQSKIDADFKNKTGAFPNINKALSFGDTNREGQVHLYKGAVESEQAYRRAISETEEAIKKFDEQLKDGKATHDEEFANLRKLDQAHKDLALSVAETEKQITEAKKKANKEAFEDDMATFEQLKEQDQKRIELQREVDQARRAQRDAELDPYRPTIEQIAGSAELNPVDSMLAQFRREQDEMRRGTGFAASHAREAQQLLMTQDDAKRAFMLEGPMSARFQDDLKKIESLQKGFRDSFITKNDKQDLIESHLRGLLEKADKEGLKIKPAMGK